MGQVPAKLFPQPAAFGDSQLNTIRQAQAPDQIQQQQMPALNFMGQSNAAPIPATAQPKPVGQTPMQSPGRMQPGRRSLLSPYYQ